MAASEKRTTRKDTNIWLIGQISDRLSARKLPSKKEVMSLFFHYKETENQTVREASCSSANDILEVWVKARIPTRLKKHVVDKIKCLIREYALLKKNKENKAKRSDAVMNRELEWQSNLDDLFDIAHATALEDIKIEEDRAFLLAQHEPGRRGKTSDVDKSLVKRESAAYATEQNFKRRLDKEEQERLHREERIDLMSSSSESGSEEQSGVADEEPCTSGSQLSVSKRKRVRRGRKKLLDDTVAISLDMAKVSDRNAALVLTPALQCLGHDLAQFTVNRSSIRRQRIQCRQKVAENLKTEFKPGVPLTIHWMGNCWKTSAIKKL